MAQKRVYNVTYNFSGMRGCCSASVLYGLGASYIREKGFTNYLKRVHRTGDKPSTRTEWISSSDFVIRPKAIINSIPITWAYIALANMCAQRGGGSSIIFLTDNVVGNNRGANQHAGKFSCRGFARWIKKARIATVIESKSVVGNHSDHVSGWMVTFKGNRAQKARLNALLVKYKAAHEAYQDKLDRIFVNGRVAIPRRTYW